MSAKKKGLGRGFESLIPTELIDESFDPTAKQDEKVSDLRHIKLTEIIADKDQPRRTFDDVAISELASSIEKHGILQPIVVTPSDGKYMIVAGERRYRAAQIAGITKIPAIVRTLSNQHKLEVSLIENLQRRDLNPLETATAYLKLRDQFSLTLDQIGDRVGGKTPSTISNTLRLLRLPESVRQVIAEGKLREGQARPLIGLDIKIIELIVPRIINEEWSARAIERYVSQIKNGELKLGRNASKPVKDKYSGVADKMSKHFDAKVKVKQMSRGTGQIVISYKNDDDFQRIAKILNN